MYNNECTTSSGMVQGWVCFLLKMISTHKKMEFSYNTKNGHCNVQCNFSSQDCRLHFITNYRPCLLCRQHIHYTNTYRWTNITNIWQLMWTVFMHCNKADMCPSVPLLLQLAWEKSCSDSYLTVTNFLSNSNLNYSIDRHWI